jgi:hypothetical protein
MFKTTLGCCFLILAIAVSIPGQQNSGSIKGTVTDQLGSLITNARVVLKDDRGSTTSVMSSSVGAFEFKNLRPGVYEVRVVAPGFTAYEEKGIAVRAQHVTVSDVQLGVELEEQQVTIDDRTLSTDADNNANAVVLRGRNLEALPNDPTALSAALQALAGPK